jgi:hypothetical protein
MNRFTRSLCIVGAMLAIVFALAAPSFAGCNGCVQQVQAVYAQPVIQPLAVVQPYYAAPLVQRQVIKQVYAQPVIQQQVIKQAVVAPVQRQVIRQRIVQPRVQRQVIRTRNVQAISAY